jgi:sulfite reductase (ferredoxin)
MKFADLEETMEPIFAMWKSQRITADEALGDFSYRVGWPAIKEFMEGYKPGDYVNMADPFAPELLPTPDGSVGITTELLAQLEGEAASRGLDATTLLDMIVKEAFEG